MLPLFWLSVSDKLWTVLLTNLRVLGSLHSASGGEDRILRGLAQKCRTILRRSKEGMKNFGRKMGKEIAFMFQKQAAYERGLLALQATDPALADYLRETRTSWSQRLIETRNAIDHDGWALPVSNIRCEMGRWKQSSRLSTANQRWSSLNSYWTGLPASSRSSPLIACDAECRRV